MTDTMVRVFVDGRPLDVAPGATALDAVNALDPVAASDIEAGRRVIVDSRGLPIPSTVGVVPGSIFRVIKAR